MGDVQDELAKTKNRLAAAEDRIAELEGDQDTLLEDVERLNRCLTRAYEIRQSAQERLKSARAEVIKLRGQLRGDAAGPPQPDPGEDPGRKSWS